MTESFDGATVHKTILIRINDNELQAYAQRYPTFVGPDDNLNKRCLDALKAGIQFRQPAATHDVKILSAAETAISKEFRDYAVSTFTALKIPEPQQEVYINDLAWKIKHVPSDAKRILSLGCGGGHELVFLRAAAPNAEITAIDWIQKADTQLLKLANVDFMVRNILEVLPTLGRDYDVVFTNHVIEHLYDPDKTLADIAQRLGPSGWLISGLPMDGMAQDMFAAALHRAVESPGKINNVDMGYLDAGHPWKTDPSDLTETLQRAGFGEVTICQRGQHPTRHFVGSLEDLARYRARMAARHRMTLGATYSVLRALFPRAVPFAVMKVLSAIERRVGVGTNALKNSQTEEALIIARKPV